jgi:hypothetical protein
MAVILPILTKFDDSGIRKAHSAFGKLSGLGKSLGGFLSGAGLGVSGLTDVAHQLEEGVKLAVQDATAQKLLANQLKNTTHANKEQIESAKKLIEKTSMQTGIAKDKLYPAYTILARGTKSISVANSLFQLSLDASAATGKDASKIALALAKAHNGNTTALARMFPELKKSKDVMHDLNVEVAGAAAANVNPFDKFNNALELIKEKIGSTIMPALVNMVDYITQPGGPADQVMQFFDDVANPKTDVGKTFIQIKDAVGSAVSGVKDFFALFGNGDAMKGFGNVAAQLVQALPALIALKGIMALAKAGTTIANLARAIGLISAQNAAGGLGAAGGAGISVALASVSALALTQLATLWATNAADAVTNAQLSKKGLRVSTGTSIFSGAGGETMALPVATKGDPFAAYKGLFGNTNVTVNVQSADPNAVVAAIGRWTKTNGKLPAVWLPAGAAR